MGVMTEFRSYLIGLCFDLSAMYTRMNTELQTETAEDNIGKNFLEIPLNIKYKFGLPVVGNVFSPTSLPALICNQARQEFYRSLQDQDLPVAWNVGIGFEIVKHLQIAGSPTDSASITSPIIG